MGLAHLKIDHFLANAALFQCAVLAYHTVGRKTRFVGLFYKVDHLSGFIQ
jgi:hypothetical protein